MRVVVDAPAVSGDTVVFRWTQTEPNPFQYENTFFLRYEGIDLNRFSLSLFFEIFLGLQLKVFAAYGKPVEVVFPEPIPFTTAVFWQAYHDAEHVTVGPIANVGTYSPWADAGVPVPRRKPIGILFGGGKDSTLATCLLAESYGADDVVLLQFVAPTFRAPKAAEHLERRQEEMMLRPARDRLGVATQRAWTNYMAQHHRSQFRARPHLELYTVGLLPAMLVWGVSVCTTSLPWLTYSICRLADDRVRFRYAKSRPEMLATQSTHYCRVFGADVTLTNVNLHFTPLTSVRVLAERYPAAFTQVVMCLSAEVGERWCYHCNKCVDYALFCLACGMVDPRFDYDRFFAKSRAIRRVVAYLEGGVERSVYGNAPRHPGFSPRNRYLIDCHAMHAILPELVADRLSGEALANLLLVKAGFGNTAFPVFDCIPVQITGLLGNEPARRVAAIASQHLDVVESVPSPFLTGDATIEYDFGIKMTPKTAFFDQTHGEN